MVSFKRSIWTSVKDIEYFPECRAVPSSLRSWWKDSPETADENPGTKRQDHRSRRACWEKQWTCSQAPAVMEKTFCRLQKTLPGLLLLGKPLGWPEQSLEARLDPPLKIHQNKMSRQISCKAVADLVFVTVLKNCYWFKYQQRKYQNKGGIFFKF